jgi:23S rRNA (pseudouridine1915-N3)-methyltransferase
MKTNFILLWSEKTKKEPRNPFKQSSYQDLFSDYILRAGKFSPATVKVMAREEFKSLKGTLWLCDTSPSAKMLTSEALAKKIENAQVHGVSILNIAIGPHDGFSDEDRKRADWLWSFGALTLPHELAAVIAAEQIYRAWTIIKRHPYHLGHK